MTQLIYGLVDMQSFYASCEVASREEYSARRKEFDDSTDPPLVVSGDPARRSGIILAATPTAKRYGVENAMRLGEALRLYPRLVVVRPHMAFYLHVSVRIQMLMQQCFPLQEQFSVDEGFIVFPYSSTLFPDPIAAARNIQAAFGTSFASTRASDLRRTSGSPRWQKDGQKTPLSKIQIRRHLSGTGS